MPELPEVETTRRGIEPYIHQQLITQVDIHQPRLRWPISQEIAALAGQRIDQVRRRAKYLLLDTQQGSAIVHLGMSGSLRVVTDKSAVRKHDHVVLHFGEQLRLHYHDPRRFGCWLWHSDPLEHTLLRGLGPEPLSAAFNAEHLHAKAKQRRRPIKPWLMDNKVVVGVGNIYASEALFSAKIHPETPVGTLSKAQWQPVCQIIKATLQASIDQGGTTLRDFVNPSDEPGYFAQQLSVYGREGQACKRCQQPIHKQIMAQRATFYCPQCQPLLG